MGRRDLNGVAAGLLGAFASRNNDVDGYWGLGLLRSFAERHQLQALRFDIANGSTVPDDPFLVRICRIYQTALERQLLARGLDRSLVVEAEVLVSFDSPAPSSTPPSATYGEPFTCSVRLLDDRETEHRQTLVGHCARHDPARESRSTRG